MQECPTRWNLYYMMLDAMPTFKEILLYRARSTVHTSEAYMMLDNAHFKRGFPSLEKFEENYNLIGIFLLHRRDSRCSMVSHAFKVFHNVIKAFSGTVNSQIQISI